MNLGEGPIPRGNNDGHDDVRHVRAITATATIAIAMETATATPTTANTTCGGIYLPS